MFSKMKKNVHQYNFLTSLHLASLKCQIMQNQHYTPKSKSFVKGLEVGFIKRQTNYNLTIEIIWATNSSLGAIALVKWIDAAKILDHLMIYLCK